jgi:hypothetical protein
MDATFFDTQCVVNGRAPADSQPEPAATHKRYVALSRVSDPATSKAAAEVITRKAGKIVDVILTELHSGNFTGKQLSQRTGIPLNSITPRFAKLHRTGVIHAASGSGRETVWALVGKQLSQRTGIPLNSITPRFAKLHRTGVIHAASGSGRETVWALVGRARPGQLGWMHQPDTGLEYRAFVSFKRGRVCQSQ